MNRFDARRLDIIAREDFDDKPRVRGSIGGSGIQNRCDCPVKIEAYADSDRTHDDEKDGSVDLQGGFTKPPEEQYERDVNNPVDDLRQYR